MKTSFSQRLFQPLIALTCATLCNFSLEAQAAPAAKIVAHRVAKDNLYVTIRDGQKTKEVLVEKKVPYQPHVLIVDGGYAIIYQTRGSAPGGYENETDAVKRYNVNGVKKTILNKPLNVFRLREVRAKSTRNVYVISMADGGAGISTLYLADFTKGELWEQGAARFAGIRNGKVIVSLYTQGEDGVDAPPIGNLYLDLDKLLNEAYKYEG